MASIDIVYGLVDIVHVRVITILFDKMGRSNRMIVGEGGKCRVGIYGLR